MYEIILFFLIFEKLLRILLDLFLSYRYFTGNMLNGSVPDWMVNKGYKM